jgi:hypothetical protein
MLGEAVIAHRFIADLGCGGACTSLAEPNRLRRNFLELRGWKPHLELERGPAGPAWFWS